MKNSMTYTVSILTFILLLFACTNIEELYPEFWSAAAGGDLQKVEQLVDKGLDVNKKDMSGGTALFQAATEGHTDVVEFLISKGAEVNIREKSMGLSPLSAAASNGHNATVSALLDAGATDINGAIGMAEQYYRTEIVQLLTAAK